MSIIGSYSTSVEIMSILLVKTKNNRWCTICNLHRDYRLLEQSETELWHIGSVSGQCCYRVFNLLSDFRLSQPIILQSSVWKDHHTCHIYTVAFVVWSNIIVYNVCWHWCCIGLKFTSSGPSSTLRMHTCAARGQIKDQWTVTTPPRFVVMCSGIQIILVDASGMYF